MWTLNVTPEDSITPEDNNFITNACIQNKGNIMIMADVPVNAETWGQKSPTRPDFSYFKKGSQSLLQHYCIFNLTLR